MTRPLIQIDDEGNSREMTEEEFATHQEFWQSIKSATDSTNETLTPNS
jgi:hypothetical protein